MYDYCYVDVIVQINGATALAWAANGGHEQVVDVLLKAGANPDVQIEVTL